MSSLRRILTSVVDSVTGRRRPHRTTRRQPTARTGGRGSGPERDQSPGQFGPSATTIATRVDGVTMSYNPSPDGDPDPGEIVWTWVPYEENDGRGKDRPVLVVAREPRRDTVLAVPLSSQDHSDHAEWVSVGTGGWDGRHRESWADTDRVLRVHPTGMRREGATLGRDAFDRVADALRTRYGWN